MKASNFDIRIDKQTALYLLANHSLDGTKTYLMCKEYGDIDDWVGMVAEDVETLEADDYETFELWTIDAKLTDRCQHIDYDTTLDGVRCRDCGLEESVNPEEDE